MGFQMNKQVKGIFIYEKYFILVAIINKKPFDCYMKAMLLTFIKTTTSGTLPYILFVIYFICIICSHSDVMIYLTQSSR